MAQTTSHPSVWRWACRTDGFHDTLLAIAAEQIQGKECLCLTACSLFDLKTTQNNSTVFILSFFLYLMIEVYELQQKRKHICKLSALNNEQK